MVVVLWWLLVCISGGIGRDALWMDDGDDDGGSHVRLIWIIL